MPRSRLSLALPLLTVVLLSMGCWLRGSRSSALVPVVPPPAPIVVTSALPKCLDPGPQPEPPTVMGATFDPTERTWIVPDDRMTALLAYMTQLWAWGDKAADCVGMAVRP